MVDQKNKAGIATAKETNHMVVHEDIEAARGSISQHHIQP
jgi:hypothetical protein